MKPKLLAYEYVPAGFETVIENEDVEMGKTWNLWHNVKLSDDPESWDNEIKSINTMQSGLGELSVDQRLIRAQMAEFCRVCPLFPESIEVLCIEIGENRFFKPSKIGCEGRDLLDSLGYHDPPSLNERQKEILENYARSLENWLEQNQPKTSTELKVFGFLGQRTDRKVVSVEKLVDIVNSSAPSVSSFRELTKDVCKETQKDPVNLACDAYRGRPFNCFECLPEDVSVTKCQCCYSMFLDACLLCVGTSGEKRSMLDEFRRFVEEKILAYSVALNSWLKQASSKPVTNAITTRYVSADKAKEIAQNIHSFLGKKDEVKEWLTACLLKTVKDNQRWHKRTELIDNFPEATSWFTDTLDDNARAKAS
jgi:hypothetical protein